MLTLYIPQLTGISVCYRPSLSFETIRSVDNNVVFSVVSARRHMIAIRVIKLSSFVDKVEANLPFS